MRKHLQLHRISMLELEQLFAVALDAEVGLVGRGLRKEGHANSEGVKGRKKKTEGINAVETTYDRRKGQY